MIEWELIEGGNAVKVTTSLGSRTLTREEWVDIYRKELMDKPKIITRSKEVIITTIEDEIRVMKNI